MPSLTNAFARVATPSSSNAALPSAPGSSGSAAVPLRWQKPQQGTPAYYRVEVATSPFFVSEGRVIERDQLVVTQFIASDLRPGAYFWRIRATAPSGQTSEWTEPLKFIVATEGASLAVVPVSNLSAVHLGGNVYLIRGTTSSGTTVLISGREAVATADGRFQVQTVHLACKNQLSKVLVHCECKARYQVRDARKILLTCLLRVDSCSSRC